MIRSLYFRIAATFLLVVVISIALAFLLTNQLFKEHSRGAMQSEIDSAFERIEQLNEVSEPSSLESFLKEIANIHHLSIVAVSESNERIVVGERAGFIQRRLTAANLTNVRTGGTANLNMFPQREGNTEAFRQPPAVGKLVKLGDEEWSLFVQPDRFPQNSNFIETVVTLIISLLIIGSILIVIAARFLVNPIKRMNKAALGMASGNFSVRLPARSGDELGELAGSMNKMAHSLSRIETMRQDFVANVSHEIGSPLTSIQGFAEALRSESVTDEERRRYVDIIQKESERLSKLSENLLKLSSLDSKHHPFHPSWYRLDKQLRQIILANEPAWLGKGLLVELYSTETTVHADEDMLNQVWTNLITNAIKFTPEGGEIQIRLSEQEGNAVVNISDTGCGIPAEDRERIFERFYKGDPSRNSRAGGNGLGLSIAQKIVELHEGAIVLEPSEPGRSGTSFTVRLPMRR
ncbi:HAMP domain-containing sensor histidine kinase [Paenibacillus sp. HB172176]|uniref:sensor histidine kinase n=1 Tax=Paenibacillus sp. HB172176 TaxID=2493690 RepID=UPI00143B5D0F|nr:HAMP domain-containing sensor histidine kinase [Paenibacillus sp. HB172176]